MDTPSKKPECSSMTHDEEEEMQHDISKLQGQVQKKFLSQGVAKNEIESKMDGLNNSLKLDMESLKDGMKVNMDDIEAKMKGNMEDLKNGFKTHMEGLKEGLKNLLQEILCNREKVLDETHDENKINVNHDFIDSNVGLKTHHIPKINMRKFDGKDPITWIL